ncbi:MAG: hypothetical protein KGJ60_13080 [Verrucomicrobiota bacterium]|nr:hypothetical protein [Verrucomicrobiota bacterium]
MKAKLVIFLLALSCAAIFPAAAQPSWSGAPANPATNIVVFPPRWSLIANPLFHFRGDIEADAVPDNSVGTLFRHMPNGTILVKFDDTTHQFSQENVFRRGHWSYPEQSLAPGEGAFLYNPTRRKLRVVFAGDWGFGASVSIPAGFSLASSPQFGTINFATTPPQFPILPPPTPGPVMSGNVGRQSP